MNNEESDGYALGLHLFSDRNSKSRGDFSMHFNAEHLDLCNPKTLAVEERKFMHLLNSLKPNGLNLDNPFSIPLLYK